MKKLFQLLLLLSFTLSSYAQQSIHGNVVDSQSGEPLPGVTVMVKGMSIGTSTDIDGRFSITLPPPSRVSSCKSAI
ncbi:carboxypeptidase-like regulatory domain-containing protein [uncultured Muribaculum sp.]|uniref:carboxypeptidase-like regulatory domain-containing protein n=1 Tax=uncultured Muribaculum sp. TaxID=1918613 RepID=UPI0025AED308|nr:carboxypeptidase-like regulatory domain-containing protein [uncultured Muribaculum sp.]